MDFTQLEKLIKEGLSSYQISEKLGKSATNVRYWLKKHKLTTIQDKNAIVAGKCSVCDKQLEKQQVKFCSGTCKQKDHYNKTKGKNTNSTYSQNNRGNERKAAMINKMGGGCSVCGYSKNMGALQFHHTGEKHFSLDIRKFSNLSMDRLEEEAKLCIILCANCHAEHHYPQFENWKNQ